MSFLKVIIISCFLFIMNNSLAQQKECAEVLKNFQSKSVIGEKELSVILQKAYPNIVRPFLKNNQIDFRAKSKFGRSILHELAIMGYVEAVDLLLRLKEGIIPVHAQNEYGRTVLHEIIENYIMSENPLEVVKLLLADSHIDVNARDKYGWTALHEAIVMDKLELVKLLLKERRVDVNIQDGEGQTVLHYAVDKGDLKLLKILLADVRMDVHARDKYGRTALDIAIKKDYNEIKELLLEASQRVLQLNDGVTL